MKNCLGDFAENKNEPQVTVSAVSNNTDYMITIYGSDSASQFGNEILLADAGTIASDAQFFSLYTASWGILKKNPWVATISTGIMLYQLWEEDKADFADEANPKPVNLPSYKKIGINIDHILSGHQDGGWRQQTPGAKKTTFPGYMSAQDIEKTIRGAYRNGSRIGSSGGRILVEGPSDIGKIRMYVNTSDNIIESAWPTWK